MLIATLCFFLAFGAVWTLSTWRLALIWAITVLGLIIVQGYLTYVVLDYINVPAVTTSL